MAGSMKDIKLRIKSVESTMQITKAMELVASSKMRRAKERVEHSRPFQPYQLRGGAPLLDPVLHQPPRLFFLNLREPGEGLIQPCLQVAVTTEGVPQDRLFQRGQGPAHRQGLLDQVSGALEHQAKGGL